MYESALLYRDEFAIHVVSSKENYFERKYSSLISFYALSLKVYQNNKCIIKHLYGVANFKW